MRCDEMAEFVSALCDGEEVPRAAAEHVRGCGECRERLREYMEMGAELRVMASLATEASVSPRVWSGRNNRLANLWSKGWETMRIPRLAFVMLVAAVVGLGSTFAVVQVKAHGNGSVLLLKIAKPGGEVSSCALSLVDKKLASCGSLGSMGGRMVGFTIDLIGRKGDGVELAVRTKNYGPQADGNYTLDRLDAEPKQDLYLEPGQTAKADIPGVAPLALTGEWLDHMPVTIGASGQDVQAGPEELRVLEPLLISDKAVLGEMDGGSAIVDKAGEAIGIYMPGQGHFVLSLSPMKGAVEAKVASNRISFEEGGRAYTFVTASPVCRSEHVWVVRQPETKTDDREHGGIGAGELKQMAPELVME